MTGIKNKIFKALKLNTIPLPVILLKGAIGTGRGYSLTYNNKLQAKLNKAFSIKKAPAVALVINSPGGSPAQSYLIYSAIRSLAEKNNKEVIVFTEEAAASGGYMLAIAGDYIVSNPYSITGSIGVVSASFGLHKAIEHLNIERRLFTAGVKKVPMDQFSQLSEEQIDDHKKVLSVIHEQFIDLVKNRRGEKLDYKDEELFSGKFWVGNRAKELGIVDEIGTMDKVLKERYGENISLKYFDPQDGGLLKSIIPTLGGSNSVKLELDILEQLDEKFWWSKIGL